MAHFAKLNENNIVLEVHVVDNTELKDETGNETEQKGIDFLISWCNGSHTNWKQTSYNATFRKNYAGMGYAYDTERDAFIPPKQFASWVLNEDTCHWESPIPMPVEEGKIYNWDEDTTSWIEVTV